MANMAVAGPEEAAHLDALSPVSAIALALAWAILFAFVAFSLARFFSNLCALALARTEALADY